MRLVGVVTCALAQVRSCVKDARFLLPPGHVVVAPVLSSFCNSCDRDRLKLR